MSNCGKLLQSSHVLLQITIRKWQLTGYTVRKGYESIIKQALDWKTEGAKEERKTEADLEKDSFGDSRKMRQNKERG
jgi:hypothetical protein